MRCNSSAYALELHLFCTYIPIDFVMYLLALSHTYHHTGWQADQSCSGWYVGHNSWDLPVNYLSVKDTVGTVWYDSGTSCINRDLWTLSMQGLSYTGLIRSLSWLLMPWLFASPGHQQPWYWLCKLGRSLFYMRNDFDYLCHVSVEE